MEASRRRGADRALRRRMRSPGRPPVGRREHRQRFWEEVARGVSSEKAAVAAGVSPAVGARWFRECGGMPPLNLRPQSRRYLSFVEREEIAVLRARGRGVREIARHLGRSPSTISRELRRNAAYTGRQPRVSGHDRSMARRSASETSKACETRYERRTEAVCTGSPRRPDRGSRWYGRAGPLCALDRTASRSPTRPAVGGLVESRADRQQATGRLPRR